MAKKCASCPEIPSWSYSENIVAFCPVVQKYVKVTDGCEGAKAEKKAAQPKKAPAKKK